MNTKSNNLILNFSNEELQVGKPSIFLAGPTKRNGNVKESWRKDAWTYLKKKKFYGIVYIPEYINEPFNKNLIEKQCLWERQALENASCILFWIPRDIKNDMPAFTTNVEFGTYLQRKPNQIVYARPDNADKMIYLDWLWNFEQKKKQPIYNSLEEGLDAAISIAYNDYNSPRIRTF